MCKRIMKHQTSPTGEIPFYKIGTFGGKANAYISRELFEQYKQAYPYPQQGQVLLSAAGTLGKSIIFDGQDAYFQDSNIVWIDNDETLISNTFLNLCLKYYVDWDEYKTDGTVIPRLYNDDVYAISIPILTKDEQRAITKEIGGYENEISLLEQELSEMQNKKSDILKRFL